MNFQKSKIYKKIAVNTLLALLSGVLFAIPWAGSIHMTIFLALIPLLVIERSMASKKALFIYNSIAIIMWHLCSVLWIAKAAEVGIWASTTFNIVLWNTPLLLYVYARRKYNKSLAYVILASGIVAVEYLNIANSEVTWPWLILGNAFANATKYVQWYEYTGVLGGTLWAVVINILLFEAIDTRKKKPVCIAFAVLIVVKAVSLSMYHLYESSPVGKTKVALIQPNFDPYSEKFSMGIAQQLDVVDSLMWTLPMDVEYIVMPETTLDEELEQCSIDASYTVLTMKQTLADRFPKADVIMGSMTYISYENALQRPSPTARKWVENSWYDISNSSIYINPHRKTEIYKKSKLVIGVEMLPFNNLVSSLGDLSVKLGGTSGVLMPQDSTHLFAHTFRGIKAGGVVCYESVYGEHFSRFVRDGAQLMFVVTNDGWWDETLGYKQHFSYSKLRAIETRRWIGRSANTGISAFINSKGDVVEDLGWWKRGALVGDVELLDKETFYTKYGDYVGSIASYVFILMLLYMISLNYKRKLLSDN